MSWKQTILLCLGILLAGGAITTVIFSTEPTAQRTGATKTTAMLVDVLTVQRDTVQPTIEAMGTVRPVQDVVLRPRVEGKILQRSAAFTPGGYVQEGETLLQIDPSDYENTLQQRKGELRQAESDLKIEMGRQNVARQDYQLLDDTLSEENRALVLREPQLNAARSEVESARAAVEQARLNLRRTRIEAPFDAHILRRNVNVGSQVAPGDELARLVGLDRYWVEATVPLSKLQWLSVPEEADGEGPPARVHNRTAWEDGAYREGHLAKVVGALEDRTRMARVLIEVPDPHASRPEHDGQPRLMIGSYVETQLQAQTLTGVFRLNRDYVRDDETVWVMKDGKLQIRDAEIVFRDATYAYIRSGLEDGDKVVTTNLTTVTDGAPLRLNGSSGDRGDVPDPAQ
jgi:RND family efflux transporter MFP subunit